HLRCRMIPNGHVHPPQRKLSQRRFAGPKSGNDWTATGSKNIQRDWHAAGLNWTRRARAMQLYSKDIL
ncbi:MAG: hypothetical protein P8H53_09425, partial [Paracoccaceae bacterium]|nr:hypothetical protein [Paracoccaceae bacterium]